MWQASLRSTIRFKSLEAGPDQRYLIQRALRCHDSFNASRCAKIVHRRSHAHSMKFFPYVTHAGIDVAMRACIDKVSRAFATVLIASLSVS